MENMTNMKQDEVSKFSNGEDFVNIVSSRCSQVVAKDSFKISDCCRMTLPDWILGNPA